MVTNRRIAVVMAGGSGERFWPLSRVGRPKQLLRLADAEGTLLEHALQRAAGLADTQDVYIATTQSLQAAIEETDLADPSHVLSEPAKRNTLGCMAWVAATLIARFPSDWENLTLAVLTADHLIQPVEGFLETAREAMNFAEGSAGLVTIGITPTRPETGFGYIEVESPLTEENRARQVLAFREKPYQDLADEYFASGRHLWNSGMFFWTLKTFMSELREAFGPAHSTVQRIAESLAAGHADEAERQFAELPNISIDYALLERSDSVYVIKAGFAWDDVGTYDALSRTMRTDGAGNVVFGKALALRSSGSVIYNEDADAVVCALGVHGLVVVVSDGAVLVCPQHEAQHVRDIVAKLRENHPEHL
jgi:mannose-1-phosphate guanylyltransferase